MDFDTQGLVSATRAKQYIRQFLLANCAVNGRKKVGINDLHLYSKLHKYHLKPLKSGLKGAIIDALNSGEQPTVDELSRRFGKDRSTIYKQISDLKKGFSIYKKDALMAFLRVSPITLLFAFIAIFVDLKMVFPAEMNIPFPEALLFYPAIGLVVEMLFHVLPLALLLFLTGLVFNHKNTNGLMWGSMIIVALLEPVYQVVFMEEDPLWAKMLTWINLFVFNLLSFLIPNKSRIGPIRYISHNIKSIFLSIVV